MTGRMFFDPPSDPATQHAPTCRAEFMAAAVRLRADQHLQPADIAQILGLSTNAVRELLHLADTGEERFGTSVPASPRRESSKP